MAKLARKDVSADRPVPKLADFVVSTRHVTNTLPTFPTKLTSVDVTAGKVEIEQTQQMLQEAQKAHNKAIAKSYEQLRNLLSGKAQSQWDRLCREMHERDLWAAVNGQVTKGKRP